MSRYTVYVIPRTWKEIKNLPGNMRQRVKRAVDALADNPRPSKSKKLNGPDLEHELRRLGMWKSPDDFSSKYGIIQSGAEGLVHPLSREKKGEGNLLLAGSVFLEPRFCKIGTPNERP